MTEFQGALLLAQLTRLEKQTLKGPVNAEILHQELRDVPGIRLLDNEPRMTRRCYHFYSFSLDTEKPGVSVSRFIEALAAEGAPAGRGYDEPVYANGFFQKANQAGARHPIIAPFAGKGLDYSKVSCPVCDQVCRERVWIRQSALLAEADDMRALAAAVRKVVETIEEIR